jgi:S-DNA-T family DNA segregation ATPase FtsK/SpoIIIE
MAGKTSKPATGKGAKTSHPGKSSTGKPAASAKGQAAAPRKATAAKKPSAAKTGKMPAPKPSRLIKPAPANKPSAKPDQPKPAPVSTGISLDRKLDIIGIILALVGLLTLLSLLSSTRSEITGGWVNLIGKSFGWGMYLLPLALIAVGLWLVLRNFQRIPTVSVERLLGLTMLFAWLLVLLHFATLPPDGQASFDTAAAGEGGGYVGGFVLNSLQATLGTGGAAIALAAWLVIALALALDVSVVDLFRWLPRSLYRLQDAWDEYRVQQEGRARGSSAYTGIPAESGDLAIPLDPGAPPQPLATAPQPQSFTPAGSLERVWVLPQVAEILDEGGQVNQNADADQQRARVIEETLASFGAPANVVEVSRGPTITQFGVEPDFIESRGGRTRVRVGKIAALADDLALALSARTIRIQAPVPGKGYVGIEVPNDEISVVALRDVVESEAYTRLKSPLRFALGQDVAGNAVAADLAAMPHLLVAGATGSGKSVCVNSLISCLLLSNTPDDLRLVMVDPKRVELTGYNGIPHLLAPVVVDLERVVSVLQWILREMDQRYHKLAQAGCRNIKEYNAKLLASGEKKLPYLVVIIDELADLMMLAPDETERTLTRLAQLARATGIHLVIATQRPSVDVVTGLIKANFPARIAFAVASGVDSRVILDQPGAERLLGRGDMLFQAPDAPAPVRLQGTYLSDAEILRLVSYWQAFSGTAAPAPTAAGGIPDSLPPGIPLKQIPLWDEMEPQEQADPLLNEAIDLARRQGRASISMLQRRLRIGYTRAARLVETMEAKGIVGPPDVNTGLREVLDYGAAAPPVEE